MDDQETIRALEVAAMAGRRSRLFLWMYRHHEEFAGVLRRAGRPNWKAMARRFVADGLMPSDQQHDTARQTWLAVRKALEREAATSQPLQQSAAQPRDEFFPGHDEPPLADDDFSDIERIK